MEFRILGPLEVRVEDRLIMVPATKQRTLLVALLLHANQVLSVEQLIDVLWGEHPPARAKATLQSYVLRLRRLLATPGNGPAGDGGVLQTRPPGYLLCLDPGGLDLHRFQDLVEGANCALRDGDPSRAAAHLQTALGLWRGPALCDVDSDTLRWIEAPRLEELRLAALETRIDAELELGLHVRLVGELQALMVTHPLRERFAGQLMVALYRAGRQADALQVFRATRRRLVQELGLEPGEDLQRLHQAILARDGELNQIGNLSVRAASPSPASQLLPRELPGLITEFTGRVQELHQLTLLFDPSSSRVDRSVLISAVDGMGGVGKSTLAIQAANQLADRFPDGQLYVNLHGATPGQPPLASVNALGLLLRSLGQDPAAIPTEVEEAAVRWRSLAAQRRLLILLDNAYDAAQVRPLLPGSWSCAVLITSRQVLGTLEGARQLHLDLLPQEQALELLGRIIGPARVSAEPQAAAEVVRLCGRLPLALRIASARLAARPSWPVSELTTRLRDASHRLDELTADGLAVRAVFNVSLQALQRSPDHIDQDAAAGFGLLSLPDGPDLDVAAASRLLDEPEAATLAVLERLVDAHLLETPRPGRYQFHDLVRLHARHHAIQQHPQAELADALNRLFGYYTATAWQTLALVRPGDYRLAAASSRWTTGGQWFPDVLAALAWLEVERANLLAAISQATATPAVPAELAGELTKALYGFFSVRSYWADGARANETVLQMALRTRNQAAQAQAHNDLGVAYEFLGRYPEAIASHQASLAIRRMQGDGEGKAASLNNLGRVYEQIGRYQEAITCLLDSLTIYRALADRHGQASSLGNLGTVYERIGRYQEASACLQDSQTLFRELGERHGQASILSDIGRVQERLGRYQQALASLQTSLVLCQELGHRVGQADCLNNLGRVYARLGRLEEAVTSHQDSLALNQELDNPQGQIEALRDLGDAFQALHRTEQAETTWHQALTLCEAMQIPEADQIRMRVSRLPTRHPSRIPGG
jgi:DNA-binding SARP family transcriptional activator